MKKRGRPAVLDDAKRDVVLGIIAAGCSRRTAARFVGCSPTTIRNTAGRDPAFAKKLDRAENHAEVNWIANINAAAKKEQYWRAAAWALEHIKPERYASRSPEVVTARQVSQLLVEFAKIVCEEIPVDKYRKAMLKRFEELRRQLTVKG